MKILIGLICSMILGFLGMVFIDTGFLRGLSALMLIVPPFVIMGLIGTYLTNKQIEKHIRGKR